MFYGRCLALLLIACRAAIGQTPDIIETGFREEPRRALEPAKPAPNAKPPRLDMYGDPLPEGALRRYGTIHFRHEGATGLSFAPDGKTLVSAGDHRLCVWEVPTGKLLRELRLATDAGLHVQFAVGDKPFGLPTGRVLVVVNGSRIGLWDPHTGREWPRPVIRNARYGGGKLAFEGTPDGEVNSSPNRPSAQLIALAPDGRTAVFANHSRRSSPYPMLQVWDVATGTCWLNVLPICRQEEFGVSFSADGRLMAYLTADGSAEICETAARRRILRLPSIPGYRRMYIALAADGRSLLLTGERGNGGDERGFYECHDTSTGAMLVKPCGRKLTRGPIQAGPDGRTLVVEGSEELRIFDAQMLRFLGTSLSFRWSNRIPITFSTDGRVLATANANGAIHFWNSRTAKRLNPLPAHFMDVGDLAVSPSGRFLATCGKDDRDIRIWEIPAGMMVGTVHVPTDDLYSVHYWRDGVLVVQRKNSVETWNPLTTRRLNSMSVDVGMVAWAPNRRFMTSLKYPNSEAEGANEARQASVLQFDVHTGADRVLRRVSGASEYTGFELSPDGRKLLTTTVDSEQVARESVSLYERRQTLIVEDAISGRRSLNLTALLSNCCSFSRDGRMIALVVPSESGKPTRLQIWDVAGGRLVCEMPSTEWASRVLHFTLDDRGILQGGLNTLTLCAVATGQKLVEWKLDSSANTAALTPDGRTLLTGHSDGTALAWDLTPYRPKKIAPGDLNRVWEALADRRGEKALAAVEALTDHPEAVAFLRTKLRLAVPLPAGTIRGWCDDLAGPDFRAREAAQRRLRDQIDRAVPALEALVKSSPSAEARRRAELLLSASEVVTSPELLRDIWAVAALERIGTKDAKALLRELAAGDPPARLTREARESLERLGK